MSFTNQQPPIIPPSYREGEVNIPQAESRVLSKVLSRVYYWMAGALGLTALTAFLAAGSRAFMLTVFQNPLLMWGMIIAELVLVVVMSSRVNKMSFGTLAVIMAAYSVLNGATLSVILLVYSQASVAKAFAITAGTFAVMAVIGTISKKDYSSWSRFLMIALIGLIIASVVNLFMRNSGLEWVISIVGVVLFAILTLKDAQSIKQMVQQELTYGEGSENSLSKIALMGSLSLYLDFINLFLFILRLTSRD